MIGTDTISKMKVRVGIGTNDFTMSRGSFVYNKDYSYTSTLNFMGKNENGKVIIIPLNRIVIL